MNDRSRRFARVFANPFPYAHHVAAGRIDDLAAAFLDLLLDGKLGAEGRDDHDILRPRARLMSASLFVPIRFLIPNDEIWSFTSGL